MWARVVEFIIAIWLVNSHSVFSCPSDEVVLNNFFWINDLFCGSLVAVFALFSFIKRWEKIHLCSLLVALWLMGVGLFWPSVFPPPFALQNYLITGFLLAMFTIIPSHSSKPPKGWREFYKKHKT
jgi:hypothetical protein